mmetsp:Transcript_35393/g.65029  ORF Transcript_35393/g.65029 Transcript_35393/m.65029 type:complete len:104 (+) Transcript_35393:12-323(+)
MSKQSPLQNERKAQGFASQGWKVMVGRRGRGSDWGSAPSRHLPCPTVWLIFCLGERGGGDKWENGGWGDERGKQLEETLEKENNAHETNAARRRQPTNNYKGV